jgi:hypothetical protein
VSWSEVGAGVVMLVLAVVAIVATILYASKPDPATDAGSPADARFVVVGRAYRPALAIAYAAAWTTGAAQLDQGATIQTAVGTVGSEFTRRRGVVFDKLVTPELSTIVTPGTADADVTPAQRAAMAAAFRGMAKGLIK